MSNTLSPVFRAAMEKRDGHLVDSEAEAILTNRLRLLHLPPFETQVMLVAVRRLRFDVAFLEHRVAVELQGGMWKRGAHNRAAGVEADAVKSALAQIAGWIVIACTPNQVQQGVAGALVMQALEARGWRRNP